MLIDTHAHLYWEQYRDDLDQVLQRAKNAQVLTIINVGVDVEKSKLALNQSEEIKDITLYSTIGIHPHEVLRLASLTQDKLSNIDVSIHQDIEQLEDIYNSNSKKVIAVGECGLDFLFPSSAEASEGKDPSLSVLELKDLQRKLFQAQIDLAKKLNLPLIVHCRDDRSKDPLNIECWNECLEMIKDHYGILHCYSGTEQITKKALDLNFLVSFAGNLTYPKNEYLREAVKTLPLEKICLETDSPFLSPQSKRGMRNEPSTVKELAELVGQLKGFTFSKIEHQTTKNVEQLFKINLLRNNELT